jgi:hypothetical protein
MKLQDLKSALSALKNAIHAKLESEGYKAKTEDEASSTGPDGVLVVAFTLQNEQAVS